MSRSRYKPLGIVLLIAIFFMLPPIIALLVYAQNEQFNLTTNQQGELINPPITLASSNERWTIFYLNPDCSDVICHTNLIQLQQIPVVLGKHSRRVQLALFTLDASALELPETIQHLPSDPNTWQQLHALGTVFIADPLGNVILTYPDGIDTKKIYKDLKRLFKASRIG